MSGYTVKKTFSGKYRVTFNCLHCDSKINADEEDIGAESPCPECGGAVTVPGDAEEIAAQRRNDERAKEAQALKKRAEKGQHFISSSDPENGSKPWPDEVRPEPASRFIYKMVQIPPTIAVQKGGDARSAAAAYLESVVQNAARSGWDFYRVDSIGVLIPPGCLGSLLGHSHQERLYYVVTFRKPRGQV